MKTEFKLICNTSLEERAELKRLSYATGSMRGLLKKADTLDKTVVGIRRHCGEIIGWIYAHPFFEDGEYIVQLGVYVDKEHRRSGVAHCLYRDIASIIPVLFGHPANNVRFIEVCKHDKKSTKFWTREGFTGDDWWCRKAF